MSFKVGSLFAGIGGFDLGLERAGMETKWQVEIDDYATKILEKHWPHVKRYRDVREVGAHNLEPVDLICGGFPCQPFSVAGKQRGAEDDRHLWPEMFRIIQELRPRWVIGENVGGLVNMGERDSDVKVEGKTVVRTSESDTYSAVWTHEELLLLYGICEDLEEAGYEVVPPLIIPACATNAPHRRDRVWIIANANSSLLENEKVPSAKSKGIYKNSSRQSDTSNSRITLSKTWGSLHDEPQFLRNDNGLPYWMDRIKALGNAVVPQIPEIIGRAIMEIETND